MRSRRCVRSRRSDCSICATPASRPLVQTLVARNSLSVIARSAARSPTTDSAAPYIGEESTTRPPSSARSFRTSRSGARSVGDAPTSKVRHVPSPTAGIVSPLDGMGRARGAGEALAGAGRAAAAAISRSHPRHEGTTAACGRLAESGRRVRRPDLSFATADHYVLTSPGSPAPDAEVRGMVESLARYTADQRIVHFGPGATLTVDLEAQTVTAPDGGRHPFEVDAFRKEMLLPGRDEIGLTLGFEARIREFERRHAREMAWVVPRAST